VAADTGETLGAKILVVGQCVSDCSTPVSGFFTEADGTATVTQVENFAGNPLSP